MMGILEYESEQVTMVQWNGITVCAIVQRFMMTVCVVRRFGQKLSKLNVCTQKIIVPDIYNCQLQLPFMIVHQV